MQTFECASCQRECRTYARSPRCVCGKQMTAKEAALTRAALADVNEWPAPDKFDIVTVTHDSRNRSQAIDLFDAIGNYGELPFEFWPEDNRRNRMTYAAACNAGAARGTAPVIGFINPDTLIEGPFMRAVAEVFKTERTTVITGERFGKPDTQVRDWGLFDWVCGAAFFVRREWFDYVKGFDERYIWSWEETDACMAAERSGFVVRSLMLPMRHESPATDNARDLAFKKRGFEVGRNLYERKWPR